eukprot:GILK01011906.1.p1 GENE.GILK01011906.1~~GILK01011906.1.p1  ORF type:complete len:451 (-),score=69.76 GILK01011906.1:106-1458(-)
MDMSCSHTDAAARRSAGANSCHGNKCLGKASMGAKGTLLNDVHAEVLARRAFKCLLLDQVLRHGVEHIQTESSLLIKNPDADPPLQLAPDVSLILYISQLPCGDASIVPIHTSEAAAGPSDRLDPSRGKRSRHHQQREGEEEQEAEEEDDQRFERPHKRLKQEADINRTGAKPLSQAVSETVRNGLISHSVGILRTKSGRSDIHEHNRTLSMSCSDKICRWNLIGLQGAVLSHIVAPIYLRSIVIGGSIYDQSAVARGLYERLLPISIPEHLSRFRVNQVELYHTTVPFVSGRCEVEGRANVSSPSGFSLIWHVESVQEVIVGSMGVKQGASKKALDSPNVHSALCKRSLFQRFQRLIEKFASCCRPCVELASRITTNLIHEETKDRAIENCEAVDVSYRSAKRAASRYIEMKDQLRSQLFPDWILKPDLERFTLRFATGSQAQELTENA